MTLDEVRKNAYKNAQGKSNSKVANINEKKVELDKAVNAIKEGGLLKVPRPDNNVYRRVAKFLLIIGKDEAAKVLQHISQEQTEKIVAELATIQGVDSSERDQIMNEFHDLLQQSRESGGLEVAREILNKAYGKEKADELIKSSVQFPEGKPFVYLNDKSSEKISALLKDESAAVKALVLSHIESQKAADVISKMAAPERTEVITRLAKMKGISPEVIRSVDSAMYEKTLALSNENEEKIDGLSSLAEILRRLPSSYEDEILASISKEDASIGESLRSKLFTLDDVENSDDRFIQEKLRDMSEKEIAYLIAGKKESFRKKILANVSTARGDTILEEEVLHKPMLKKDVDEVTNIFLKDLRLAYEDGKFRVAGRDNEEYVE